MYTYFTKLRFIYRPDHVYVLYVEIGNTLRKLQWKLYQCNVHVYSILYVYVWLLCWTVLQITTIMWLLSETYACTMLIRHLK